MTLPELLAKHSLPAEVIEKLLEQDREIARLRAASQVPYTVPVYVPVPAQPSLPWEPPSFERYTITCGPNQWDQYLMGKCPDLRQTTATSEPFINTHNFRGFQ